jgi:hypothetical protein
VAFPKNLRQHHLMQNRRMEIALGLLAFVIGCILIYDAYDARGKRLPWPASGLTPWLWLGQSLLKVAAKVPL